MELLLTSTVALLDYDVSGPAALELFRERWDFAGEFLWPMRDGKVDRLHVDAANSKVYETEHGTHVYVRFKNDLPDITLNVLQFSLGSDYAREAHNYRRIVVDHDGAWNLLAQAKEAITKHGYQPVSEERLDPESTKRLRSILRRRRNHVR